MKKVYLLSGIRTPFAKAGTDLKSIHAAELGRFALSELLARTGLSAQKWGQVIDEVIIGNTGTPSDAANISRVVALKAGLPKGMSAYTVHRNCASGLEAISQAFAKIQANLGDVYVAGGTESMSQMPLFYNARAVSFFEKLSRVKTLTERLGVLTQIPVKDFLNPRISLAEGLTDPFCGLNMGQTAEVLAKEFGISRLEQDTFALQSHQKTVASQEAGYFKTEIAPYTVPPEFKQTMEYDSGPRKNQTIEALQKLKPYFDRKFGSVTVGNACPITDGAAMSLIVSEEGLKKFDGLKPLARILAVEFAGLEPERMGLGPVYSTHKALNRAGVKKVSDFDVVEINEAFAAQVLACVKALDSTQFCKEKFGRSESLGAIDPKKLNPNGGAIAIGHPVGCSGTRIAITAAVEMNRKKGQLALASLCIGGGQGGSLVLEAIGA
jgi:acetyl-CoA acyltransferase